MCAASPPACADTLRVLQRRILLANLGFVGRVDAPRLPRARSNAREFGGGRFLNPAPVFPKRGAFKPRRRPPQQFRKRGRPGKATCRLTHDSQRMANERAKTSRALHRAQVDAFRTLRLAEGTRAGRGQAATTDAALRFRASMIPDRSKGKGQIDGRMFPPEPGRQSAGVFNRAPAIKGGRKRWANHLRPTGTPGVTIVQRPADDACCAAHVSDTGRHDFGGVGGIEQQRRDGPYARILEMGKSRTSPAVFDDGATRQQVDDLAAGRFQTGPGGRRIVGAAVDRNEAYLVLQIVRIVVRTDAYQNDLTRRRPVLQNRNERILERSAAGSGGNDNRKSRHGSLPCVAPKTMRFARLTRSAQRSENTRSSDSFGCMGKRVYRKAQKTGGIRHFRYFRPNLPISPAASIGRGLTPPTPHSPLKTPHSPAFEETESRRGYWPCR